MHHRDAQLHRGVVEHVAHREVVSTVHDDVELGDDVGDVRRVETDIEGEHVHIRVERGEGLLRRVDLPLPDPIQVVQDLPLQVRLVHHVHVDDSDGADARGRQVQRRRGPETTGSQQQHLGSEQLLLTFFADLGQQEVALVAVALFGCQHLRNAPLPALVLPAVESAHHRHHIGVAELLERPGSERGAHPTGAHRHHRHRLVGDLALDLALEVAPGKEHGPRHGSLFELVGFSHVEQNGPRGHHAFGLSGVDLSDL